MRGKLAVLASAVLLAVSAAVPAGAGQQTDAEAVQASYLQLRDAAAAGDVDRTLSALDDVDTVLTELSTGQRSALTSENRALVDEASNAVETAGDELARADVPPLPQILAQFLEQVFQILLNLVSLLGGPPLPTPAVP